MPFFFHRFSLSCRCFCTARPQVNVITTREKKAARSKSRLWLHYFIEDYKITRAHIPFSFFFFLWFVSFCFHFMRFNSLSPSCVFFICGCAAVRCIDKSKSNSELSESNYELFVFFFLLCLRLQAVNDDNERKGKKKPAEMQESQLICVGQLDYAIEDSE